MTFLLNPFSFGVGGGGTPEIATLTIPAGTVASTLTNFVTRIDLADLPSTWFAAGHVDGREVRVKSSGAVIPTDLVNYDATTETGQVFFKATLTTGDNVFTVEHVNGASALAVGDSNGRNAVWTDYDFAWIPEGGFVSRNGAAVTMAENVATTILSIADRSPDVVAHQGVAYDSANDTFIVIDTDELVLYDRSWNELARETTPLADSGIAGAVHIGDGCVVAGELYVCADDYPTNSIVRIAVYDSTTLAYLRNYNISGTGHQVSSICWDGTYFYTVGYNTGTNYLTSIQRWTSSWVHSTTLTTASLTTKQGITIHGGYFWISRGSVDPYEIWRVNLDGSGATKAFHGNILSSTSGEAEGITSDGTDLYWLYDESATSHVYTLADQDDPRTGHFFDARNYVKVTGLSLRTQWTVGSTVLMRRAISVNGNGAVLSYGTNNGTDANRATLAARDTTPDAFGIWNSTDVWLMDSAGASANTSYRVHQTFNGTTDRKLWRSGVAQATDTTVSQRPVSPGDTLFIGAEDTGFGEPFYGGQKRVYLRNGVLSADWLAAEFESWETPSSFYTIT